MKRDAKYCHCGALMEFRMGTSKEEIWRCLFCGRILQYAKYVKIYSWFTFEGQEERG